MPLSEERIAPAFNPEMGWGALRDLNVYNIHLLVGLFGKHNRVEYLPNVERGVDTSGILVLDYGHFKAVAIGAKDCIAEIRSTIQGDKGAITIFGATNTLPEIGVTLNGQKERIVNLNSLQHRMHDEFVAFEKMVATKDFDSVAKQLEHSLSGYGSSGSSFESFVTYKKTSSGISHCLFLSYTVVGNEISINLSVCTVLSLSIKTISLSIFRLRKNSRITSNSLSLTARCLFETRVHNA